MPPRKSFAIALVFMLLLIPNVALADDFPPPEAPRPTAEQKWLLKAGFAWDYYQRGWIDNPCENDAFVDLWGEWFGCI